MPGCEPLGCNAATDPEPNTHAQVRAERVSQPPPASAESTPRGPSFVRRTGPRACTCVRIGSDVPKETRKISGFRVRHLYSFGASSPSRPCASIAMTLVRACARARVLGFRSLRRGLAALYRGCVLVLLTRSRKFWARGLLLTAVPTLLGASLPSSSLRLLAVGVLRRRRGRVLGVIAGSADALSVAPRTPPPRAPAASSAAAIAQRAERARHIGVCSIRSPTIEPAPVAGCRSTVTRSAESDLQGT